MLSEPVLLATRHQLGDFSCGVASLDDWLKRRARPNQVSGASRTYVVAEGDTVVGYYCLASGALALNEAPPAMRRNMPDPLPIAVLGRLAVDRSYQGRGLGVALLQDAVLRTMQAGDILGIRGLLVHALSAEAQAFYQHHGFVSSPTQPMTLILSLKRSSVMRTVGEYPGQISIAEDFDEPLSLTNRETVSPKSILPPRSDEANDD
ncbi:GNAT family N-acetyltransferase [Methylomonas rosea]|uniref:GNAT family N-acetyltransferase n=1 Tax=Methylomonas rosea TaxID=2952227 RepID=A0ABT1TVR6_9GAMM|nr:GNAT family N-acetyltransferase [Methylomonas sp. WSC-7]MCQ8118829.1 GNAT family N-acetyltransferase [Methylomonas sp. WSC-7]